MFDVPASLTLADLTKPAANEDEFARLLRLARKAIVSGCDIRSLGHGQYAVSSGSKANMVYLVDVRAQTCSCPSALVCSHLAVSLFHEVSTWLPDPDGAAVGMAA